MTAPGREGRPEVVVSPSGLRSGLEPSPLLAGTPAEGFAEVEVVQSCIASLGLLTCAGGGSGGTRLLRVPPLADVSGSKVSFLC